MLALYLTTKRRYWWRDHLQALLPNIECKLWDEVTDIKAVRYAVVWRPPTGWLAGFPNLQCIVSVGAGIDHILEDQQLPAGIPIIRTTGNELTLRMREYICLHVLRLHRNLMKITRAQQARQWQPLITPPASQRRVGVMGLGKLGSDAAVSLSQLGFCVSGWANRKHRLQNIKTYTQHELRDFISTTDILVCLLPLTEATRNILNAKLFEQLPHGASIINAARGDHLVEEDLLAALDSGKLAYATLDVFRTEPLPPDHPFWRHEKILVTPHVASLIDPESGGREIAKNLHAFINGETPEDIIDPKLGY